MDTFISTHSMRPFLTPAKKAGQVAHHKQSWAMLIPAYYTLTFSPPARWGCLDFNNGATFLLLLLLPPTPPPPCRHLCLLSAFSFSLCQLDVTGESVEYAWTISIYIAILEYAWTRIPYRELRMWRVPGPVFLLLCLCLFLSISSSFSPSSSSSSSSSFSSSSLSLSLFLSLSLSLLHTKRNLRWKM